MINHDVDPRVRITRVDDARMIDVALVIALRKVLIAREPSVFGRPRAVDIYGNPFA